MPHEFDIDLFNQRDTETFMFVHAELFPPIFIFACLVLQDETEAEDVTQKAFEALWCHQRPFNSLQAINNYLFIVARNACMDVHRKKRPFRTWLNRVLGHTNNADKSLYENLLEAETIYELYKAIDKLPPRQKEILLLFFVDGKTGNEIAGLLNITEKTVFENKKKAVRYLRQTLDHLLLTITIILLAAFCAMQL